METCAYTRIHYHFTNFLPASLWEVELMETSDYYRQP
ncbi:hypothetical protein CRC_03250 [Cylindrospermopsis raciborskii CS-505]|nr:hypothetical protein CRC_03250 [Cylindrospermopsis raciborskii CS-505]